MANGFMNPQNQFLMTAGAHLMGQPYSPVPQSTFSGLGNAFDQGMGAYQNALILQEKQREAEEKRQAMAAAQAAREARAAQFQQAISNLPPDRKQALANWYAVDEPGAVKALYDMYTPAEVDNTMGDSATDSAIFTLGLDQKPRNQWTPQEVQAVENKANEIRRVNNPGPPVPPSPFATALAGSDIEMMQQVQKDAQGAMVKLPKLRTLKTLSEMIPESGSVAAPTFARIQGLVQDLGLPPLTSSDAVAVKDVMEGLQTSLVMDRRQYGPPDARFTDQDMLFYREMEPGLSQTPDGRALLLELRIEGEESFVRENEEFTRDIAARMRNGQDREPATRDALAAMQERRMRRAQDPNGHLTNADGSLTSLGQRIKSMQERMPGGSGDTGSVPVFKTEQEALASGISGEVIINGRRAVLE